MALMFPLDITVVTMVQNAELCPCGGNNVQTQTSHFASLSAKMEAVAAGALNPQHIDVFCAT
jgi:hypothetical protein